MAQAESNRIRALISEETAWAEVPAGPTMNELRIRGPISLGAAKNLITSELLQSSRNISSRVEGSQAARARFGWELTWGPEMNLLFEQAFHSDFVVIDQTSLTIGADGTAKTFTRSAGSFVTDGVLVGHYVRIKGFVAAGNNGVFRVTAVTALVLTVADPTSAMVTEAGTGNEEYHVNSLRNGTTKKSALIEMGYLDLSPQVFASMRGMRCSQIDFNIAAQSIVNGAVNFLGERLVPATATVSGSITAHAGTTPANATANVASFTKDGVTVTAIVREMAFSLNNSGRQLFGVGSKYAKEINLGSANVSGTMAIHLADKTFLDDDVNHAAIRMDTVFRDENGNYSILSIPRLRVASDVNAQGLNTDVLQNLRFEAESGSGLYTIQLDRLAA